MIPVLVLIAWFATGVVLGLVGYYFDRKHSGPEELGAVIVGSAACGLLGFITLPLLLHHLTTLGYLSHYAKILTWIKNATESGVLSWTKHLRSILRKKI